jgi:hypothetical protein
VQVTIGLGREAGADSAASLAGFYVCFNEFSNEVGGWGIGVGCC